ncbi:MAG: Gfo/Idh/MocA family oxidoreductase [Rhodothermales bacterium]|nr:Gfo/Idh/MocA family oxidoreductase [Rhodothermales bacterium]
MRKTVGKAAIRVVIIGCGGMALHHLRGMVTRKDVNVVALVDPSRRSIDTMLDEYAEAKQRQPDAFDSLEAFFDASPGGADVALIASPHVFHHDQTVQCLQSGLDVLLEKPMVTTADEAANLIRVRNDTGRLLVVAFPGSLSPAIRQASQMIADGKIGKLVGISATVWQNWATNTANTWRQQFSLSGGGFLFDTGAHMLNTVVDLAGEEFVEVAAISRGSIPGVEYSGVVIGTLKSGAVVTMHGCGETIESCDSDIKIFGTKKILLTGVWGKSLDIQADGDVVATTAQMQTPTDVWDQFVLVRDGLIENPCPPEVGLRMARLWDAIRQSAANNGLPTSLQQTM